MIGHYFFFFLGGGGGSKFFNIFGGFQKNKYFRGMKILWIFFGSSQNWTIFRGHFYAF